MVFSLFDVITPDFWTVHEQPTWTTMRVPACCPHCDEPFSWELSLAVPQELGFAHPDAPGFLFQCTACQKPVRITFAWRLERGNHPRHLQLVGGASAAAVQPRLILVQHCPHDCGTRLGLQLDPDDPQLSGVVWPDTPLVLGGYRCPKCDGEGRLWMQMVVEAGE